MLLGRSHKCSLIARFVGPTWAPSGADRTHVGLMLAPWTLLSWFISISVNIMPPQKKPATLKTSCIQLIFDDISQNKEQIPSLWSLPTALLDEIHAQLLNRSNVHEHTCLERLGYKLSHFNFSRWLLADLDSTGNPRPFDVRLLAQYQNLTKIDIARGCLEPKEWNILFPAIKYIHEVDLSCTNVTNESLKLLGDRCLDLQNLYLSCCWRVTDEGMINLVHCRRNGSWTCTKLSVLDVFGTEVYTEGARHVLLHAKVLKYFHFTNLCQVIHHLALWTKQALAEPLRLGLTCLALRHDKDFHPDQAISCIKACPNLTEMEVSFHPFDGKSDLAYMQQLTGLQKLSLSPESRNDFSFSNDLQPALPHFSTTLTSLCLENVNGLSLTVLGRNCPRLKSLTIETSSMSLSSDERPCKEEVLFSNLEHLTVFNFFNSDTTDAVSLGILLFSCHKLSRLILNRIQCLDDFFVMDWISCNSLCALEYFHIGAEHHLGPTMLWALMCHCGNLKELVVPPSIKLDQRSISLLTEKAERQMWDIEINK